MLRKRTQIKKRHDCALVLVAHIFLTSYVVVDDMMDSGGWIERRHQAVLHSSSSWAFFVVRSSSLPWSRSESRVMKGPPQRRCGGGAVVATRTDEDVCGAYSCMLVAADFATGVRWW